MIDQAAERMNRVRGAIRVVDTEPRLLAAARQLRRRLPGDERFGDPLSTAGVKAVHVVGRGVSALQPDRESVTQELGFAALQVWQSLSEAAGRGRGDDPLAILFTDLVGFSSWALRAGDTAVLELLREVGSAVESAIVARRGLIVKRLGDGLMATFLDPQDAVEAALDAQIALADVEIEGYRPRMRAGVHWGRPRRLGGDYLGVDVNIAARVVEAAKGGEVLVSETAAAQLDAVALRTGKAKRLRAEGAPRQLHVMPVTRT